MDDKRNIIMAVLLTGIILFGWPVLMEQLFPEMANKTEVTAPAVDPAAATVAGDTAAQTGALVDGGAEIATGAASDKIRPLATVLRENPRVLIETPRVKGSINLKGGRIDDLTLTDHTVDMSKDSDPVRLFSPSGTKDAYFSRVGWAGEGVAVPDDNTVWTPDQSKLTPSTPVTLSWANETGQTYTITLSIDEDYLITSEQSVTNRGENAIALKPYG
ncbi:MAG: membrane protein insertase YidC, partial [Parasphingorhabdus sp.]